MRRLVLPSLAWLVALGASVAADATGTHGAIVAGVTAALLAVPLTLAALAD